MGRPPCCDKDGIKKGPWTPEEDIILVSYIQEHGPGNWRSVPTNTGLMRCSKSCRLRWTNYLRPGIKRGNFTSHEEGMIIHLQALLGNKWAAIASYLPQRTDNDIKNYWNTHLKKKLKRFQSAFQVQDQPQINKSLLSSPSSSSHTIIDDCQHQISQPQFSSKTSFDHDNIVQQPPPPQSACYASSTENISRLLENWMKCSPTISKEYKVSDHNDNNNNNNVTIIDQYIRGAGDGGSVETERVSHNEEEDHFKTILSFDNNNDNVGATTTTTTNTTCDSMEEDFEHEGKKVHKMDNNIVDDDNDDDNNNDSPPLTFLEKWLLDETSSRQVVEEILQLPPIF